MIPDWLVPAPADREQMDRLAEFRAAHPDVIIGSEFGTWQAIVPLPDGESVITRHLLGALLDRLEELFPAGSEARPAGDQPGGPDG